MANTIGGGKRIGVLTFHNGPNFGGFMQAWHLVDAIRRMGHDAVAVNYLHAAHHRSNQIRIPLRSLGAVKARVFWALKKRGFRDIERGLCRHPFVTDADRVPWDEFDAVVVGSDVVWEYQNPAFGHDPAYFGGVPGLVDKHLIAYAASCGPANPNGPFPEFIKVGLSRFRSIGVRDDATARLVRNASGRGSALVVDPTWLGPDPDPGWSGLPRGKYLFAYGGRVDDGFGSLLRDYCRQRGWLLVSALTSCKVADKMYRSLTPFQWACLFRHAEATAIVGTLHGTLFSIKYGRPFILQNSPAIAPKIREALARTSQEFRVREVGTITKDDLEMLDPKNAAPPEIPAGWLEESRQFLARSLADVAGCAS